MTGSIEQSQCVRLIADPNLAHVVVSAVTNPLRVVVFGVSVRREGGRAVTRRTRHAALTRVVQTKRAMFCRCETEEGAPYITVTA